MSPVSLRSCSGSECGSRTSTFDSRYRRWFTWNAAAPLPTIGLSANPRAASCHHCARLLPLPSVNRLGLSGVTGSVKSSAARAPKKRNAATPSGTSTHAARRSSGHAISCRASSATSPAPATSASPSQSPAESRSECDCPSSAIPSNESANTPTAESRRHRDRQPQRRLVPLALEHEPPGTRNRREQQPAARLREQDRDHRAVKKQRSHEPRREPKRERHSERRDAARACSSTRSARAAARAVRRRARTPSRRAPTTRAARRAPRARPRTAGDPRTAPTRETPERQRCG